jgi:urease accessory protein
MSSVAVLLLGDGRFPSGGHAHSGGLEPLVEAGMIGDMDELEAFLEGRLATAGSMAAAIAAAACAGNGGWADLQAEADARTVSPAQREASRSQGRQLLRAARAVWGGPAAASGDRLAALEEAVAEGPHHALVLGATAAVAGLEPVDAARLAAYGSVAGPASAAIRLLGLDPFAVHAVLARLASAIEAVAVEAGVAALGPLEDLPCPSAPMLDIAAERHLGMEVRLFAS